MEFVGVVVSCGTARNKESAIRMDEEKRLVIPPCTPDVANTTARMVTREVWNPNILSPKGKRMVRERLVRVMDENNRLIRECAAEVQRWRLSILCHAPVALRPRSVAPVSKPAPAKSHFQNLAIFETGRIGFENFCLFGCPRFRNRCDKV